MAVDNNDVDSWIWRGKVDSFMEIQARRIDAMFESMQAFKEKDEVTHDKLQDELHDLENKFANYSAKMTMIVALASFFGTALTSALIQIIARVFIK